MDWNTFVDIINEQWNSRRINIDWLRYEGLVTNILRSDLENEDKVLLCQYALSAFTGRGQFSGNGCVPR